MDYFIPFKKSGGLIVDWDFQSIIHCLNWHNNNGYGRTNIEGKGYYLHRLLTGFTNEEIDHKNRIRHDNRTLNLRPVSHRINSHNMEVKFKNGRLIGAQYHKRDNKWYARPKINGRREFLGLVDTEIEAHLCYKMYLRGL